MNMSRLGTLNGRNLVVARGWRVEEEFVNAIRDMERVTHMDLLTGGKYMEWTTA